ncbi:MAG: FHA domain-containing protein [Myxococcota bacterium]|nr:FHA domain-containing protein [Myxococcota bacterium]
MSADPNKKSARTFQCREVLWGMFEQMAHDLECSVDYLINEAMKQYARQRSQDGARAPYMATGREPSQPGPAPTGAQTQAAPRMTAPAAFPPPPPSRLPPPPGRSAPASGRAPLPPPPGRPSTGATQSAVSSRTTLPPRAAPPPLPRVPIIEQGANGYPAPAAQATMLTLVYQGERFPITKDRFVIGRGKQSSDLTLKDPNVSRQHAMIEFQNGVYFMVDMGSTNGVEYNGQRVARKQITEGDVFRICDHDLAFSYR